jgi:hypothetical protein
MGNDGGNKGSIQNFSGEIVYRNVRLEYRDGDGRITLRWILQGWAVSMVGRKWY